jgi:hypothetical protein
MESERWFGQTVIIIKETFMRVSVKERANELIWMAVSTRGNMKMINHKVMVSTNGRMARVTKVNGKTEFSQAKASNTFQTGLFSTECGKTDCLPG